MFMKSHRTVRSFLVLASLLFFGLTILSNTARANVLVESREIVGLAKTFSALARAGGLEKVGVSTLLSFAPQSAGETLIATEVALQVLRRNASGMTSEDVAGWALDLPEPVLAAAVRQMRELVKNADSVVKAAGSLAAVNRRTPLTYSITHELSRYRTKIAYGLGTGAISLAAVEAELGLTRLYSLITRAISGQLVIPSEVGISFNSLMEQIDLLVAKGDLQRGGDESASLEVLVDEPLGGREPSEKQVSRILGLYGRVRALLALCGAGGLAESHGFVLGTDRTTLFLRLVDGILRQKWSAESSVRLIQDDGRVRPDALAMIAAATASPEVTVESACDRKSWKNLKKYGLRRPSLTGSSRRRSGRSTSRG